MCDCPEIQDVFFNNNRAWLCPSFVYRRDLDRVCITIWTPQSLKEEIGITLNYVDINTEYKKDLYKRSGEDFDMLHSEVAIWLPRQDQLQEILIADYEEIGKEYNDKWDRLLFACNDFVNGDYFDGHSMEQLWLAFYMSEKHNKKWNGKEWEGK